MLEGKVAIVTGGSKGMGRHFVDALVAEGVRVACFARPSPECDALVAEYGDRVAVIPCDVRHVEEVDRGVAETVSRFGRLDVLINNAAIFQPFMLEKATVEQIRSHVEINLLGPIWCMRTAIPHLRETRGQILSISSESVRMPFPYLSIYAATKAAVEVLSAAMRDELRDAGIRVITLRSGSVAGSTGSAGWDPVTTQEFYAAITKSGHAAFTGEPASPQSMAKAMIAALALPADVNVDFLEVRAAQSIQTDVRERAKASVS